MTVADLDRDLDRLRNAADTVSANLLALDRDPNRELLETAPLVGMTAGEWADARTALASVWDWFARFTTFLERALELRGGPRARLTPAREQELAALLSEPSIELPSDEIPLRDRDLLQGAHTTNRCTADELLDLMSGAFARARGVVVQVGAAWDELMPRVAQARASLADVAGSQRERVQQQLDTVTETLVSDPLAVTEAAVADVERAIAQLSRSAAQGQALRAEWRARVDAARAELARLEALTTEARAAYARTTEKILTTDVPEPPADNALAADLDDVVGLADAGCWDDAQARLDTWERARERCTTATAAALTASRAPLLERDHLRGRLDAYRAKAHGLGLDEDDDVTAAYGEAYAALHVAPADLASARRLVEYFQQMLTPNPEAPR